MNLNDLKQRFTDEVTTAHIHYSWDAGHAYSYIDHPIMDVEFDDPQDQIAWEEYTDAWLYENDECPPCELAYDENGRVCSGCGCHDGKNYTVEEVERIINDINVARAREGLK